MKKVMSLASTAGDRLLALLVPHAGIAKAASVQPLACPTKCWCEHYEDGSAIKCQTWENGRCVIHIRCTFCC